MQHPDVTVLVVPREQFSKTAQSLESIYATTQVPFSLVYVDGNSPPHVRRYLEKESRARGFTLLRENRYLFANEARNIGLPYCRGEYIAFVDNDVVLLPGWLENLVGCAQETDAGVVGPLYYLGEPREHRIHTAGADLYIKQNGGGRCFYERHHFVNEDANAVGPHLRRRPIDLVEFHCLLARSDLVARVGLDQNLRSFLDHDDFCLSAKAAGATIYTEPNAVACHLSPPPIAPSDLPFFILRWSNAWIDPSIRHFAFKYDLQPDDDGLQGHYRFRDAHRRRLISYLRRVVRKTMGTGACGALDRVVDGYIFDRVLERMVARRYATL
jgi:GT2 family glycosyltransferase